MRDLRVLAFLAISWAARPRRARACRLAGLQLMCVMTVPSGMLPSGNALPVLMSAAGPDSDDVADLERSRPRM